MYTVWHMEVWIDESAVQSWLTGWLRGQGLREVLASGKLGGVSGSENYQGGCIEAKHGKCRVAKWGGKLGEHVCGKVRLGAREVAQCRRLLRAAGVWEDRAAEVHKISDMSEGTKPFDCFAMWGVWSGFAFGFSCGRLAVVDARKLAAFIGRGGVSIGDKEIKELGGVWVR